MQFGDLPSQRVYSAQSRPNIRRAVEHLNYTVVNMPTWPKRSIADLRTRLLDSMHCYADAVVDCGYTDEDVDCCASILDNYLASVNSGSAITELEIREAVKKAVLDLNALNSRCGGNLIETDQREAICEIILASAQNAGIGTNDDITEEWREW